MSESELTRLREANESLAMLLQEAMDLFEMDDECMTPGSHAYAWMCASKAALLNSELLIPENEKLRDSLASIANFARLHGGAWASVMAKRALGRDEGDE